MNIKERLTRESKKGIVWVIFGTMLMAVATNFFFSPSQMVPGGFTGLAIIIRHTIFLLFDFDFPIWAINIILNVPLILLSIKIRGWVFIRRTFFAALSFSGWLFVIPEIMLVKNDDFLVAIIGGAFMGVGVGMVLLGKATTGGTDTLAALVQRALPHFSVAKIIPFLDAIVILLSIWIFGLRISLYAVISVVFMGIISDRVVDGAKNSSVAFIVSEKYRQIGDEIMEAMERGASLLQSKGMYTNLDKPVIFVAVSTKEQVILKEIVHEIDPNAFMVILKANEVRGEGFLKFSKEEL